jgi:hypothetical protein
MSQPCVIARLSGGLGNQLFMYAFAKALANRNGVPLKLDAGNFARDRTYRRKFILDEILPPEQKANRWESRALPFGHILKKLDRKLNALMPLERRYYVRERTMQFDPDIHRLRIVRPTVVEGYWQAPEYFDDLKPDMASLFTPPKSVLDPIADELSTILAAPNSVCLAIRRFEEVPNPKHHILPLEYFQTAMAKIEQAIEKPHYFIFSQNMNWARQHIKSPHRITFAQEKDLHLGAIQDLYLMSRCRHFILSNSSLHWWAAWLSASQDKIVVAPQKGWPNPNALSPNWIAI